MAQNLLTVYLCVLSLTRTAGYWTQTYRSWSFNSTTELNLPIYLLEFPRHRANQDYWKGLNKTGWIMESHGMRQMIGQFANIPISEISGQLWYIYTLPARRIAFRYISQNISRFVMSFTDSWNITEHLATLLQDCSIWLRGFYDLLQNVITSVFLKRYRHLFRGIFSNLDDLFTNFVEKVLPKA